MDNPTVFGYLRVSTKNQELQGNKESIICKCTELGYNAAKILWVEETVTGKKHWKLRKLNEIVEQIKKGDVFITFEISRIGRNYLEIIEFLSVVLQKGGKTEFCKGNFKVDNSIGSQALTFAYSISAQLERELISQRTKTALENRKNAGLPVGRPKGTLKLKLDNELEPIRKMVKNGVKLKVIAKKYNVSQNTISNFVKRHNIK